MQVFIVYPLLLQRMHNGFLQEIRENLMFPKYEYRNTPIYVDCRKPLKPCPIRFHTHIEALLITNGRACISVGRRQLSNMRNRRIL